MRPTLRLTLLRPDDEGALLDLFVANDLPEVTRYFDPFPLDAATAARLSSYGGPDLYWGVWESTSLVGLAMVRGWDGGHPQRAYGLLVDHRQHGRGIGVEATRLMLAELHVRGHDAVRARVHEDNEASLRMLRTNGFADIGRGDGRVLLEWRLEVGPSR